MTYRNMPAGRRRGSTDTSYYTNPRHLEFSLPPGCELVRFRSCCPEGEGLNILTDPTGRAVSKQLDLPDGLVCLVIR